MNKPRRVPETETPSPGVADNVSFIGVTQLSVD